MMRALAPVVFLALSAFPACDAPEPMSAAELEALLADAAHCEAGDQCVVVDTYCCPRAINVSRIVEVSSSLETAAVDEGECLADCLGPASQLEASCEAIAGEHLCRLELAE